MLVMRRRRERMTVVATLVASILTIQNDDTDDKRKDSDSDDDISLLGSGTSNHSIVRSRSANTSLGTVVAVNSAFRRRKGI